MLGFESACPAALGHASLHSTNTNTVWERVDVVTGRFMYREVHQLITAQPLRMWDEQNFNALWVWSNAPQASEALANQALRDTPLRYGTAVQLRCTCIILPSRLPQATTREL